MSKITQKSDPQLTRKQFLIRVVVGLGIFGLAAAGLVAAFRYSQKNESITNQSEATTTANPEITETKTAPPTVTSPLDGTQVSTEVADRRPLGIMIENHPDARPQFGLSLASVVYEAATEGGITRFLAIFGTHGGAKIGPVRSARPYYLGWALEWDAGYAHVGGSSLALAKIKELKVHDLDQFALGSRAYRREPRAGIATEHTMFTDTSKLWTIAEEKFGSDVNRPTIKFKKPLDRQYRGTSQSISISFSTPLYNPTWTFDPETNTYLRSQGGSFHKDAATGQTIAASNLIIQRVRRISTETMETVGNGEAIVFMDGKRIEATWNKSSINAPTIFKDVTGAEIARNPGLTWIEIVDPSMPVTVNE